MSALAMLRCCELGEKVAQGTSRPLTAAVLKEYAEASGDLNPLHLDSDVARQSGFDDVIVHGMLSMAQLGRLLSEEFGQARISRFQTRFVAVVPVGSRLLCRAWLSEREADCAWLKLEAVIVDAGERVVLIGQARIDLREEVGT